MAEKSDMPRHPKSNVVSFCEDKVQMGCYLAWLGVKGNEALDYTISLSQQLNQRTSSEINVLKWDKGDWDFMFKDQIRRYMKERRSSEGNFLGLLYRVSSFGTLCATRKKSSIPIIFIGIVPHNFLG